jgi:hypothetical protein
MANEITVTTAIAVTNGALKYTGATSRITPTQTTARGGAFTVDVGTSEETISLGDLAPGYMRFTNLDVTNFVELGFSTGVYGIRLEANSGVALFYRKTGTTLYIKADTGACKVQVEAINA